MDRKKIKILITKRENFRDRKILINFGTDLDRNKKKQFFMGHNKVESFLGQKKFCRHTHWPRDVEEGVLEEAGGDHHLVEDGVVEAVDVQPVEVELDRLGQLAVVLRHRPVAHLAQHRRIGFAFAQAQLKNKCNKLLINLKKN